MDQVAFVDVLARPQQRAAHAATVEDMGEAALDHLTAPAHGVPRDAGLRLGDPRFPDAAVEVFQPLA